MGAFGNGRAAPRRCGSWDDVAPANHRPAGEGVAEGESLHLEAHSLGGDVLLEVVHLAHLHAGVHGRSGVVEGVPLLLRGLVKSQVFNLKIYDFLAKSQILRFGISSPHPKS